MTNEELIAYLRDVSAYWKHQIDGKHPTAIIPTTRLDEAADRLAAANAERDEHLRLKNALVLKAYPAMDAVDRIRKWIDAQEYENDLITVAQLRELLGPPAPENHYEKSAPSAEIASPADTEEKTR